MQVGRQMWAIGRFFMWQNEASNKTQPCLRSYIHQLAGDRTGMEEREAEAVRHTGRFVESITTATPVLAPQNTATARAEPPRHRRRRATEETAAQKRPAAAQSPAPPLVYSALPGCEKTHPQPRALGLGTMEMARINSWFGVIQSTRSNIDRTIRWGGAASCGSVCVGGEGPACRERL